MGRKGDADTIVPLCSSCHRELHTQGMETFERRHRIRLASVAANLALTWDRLHPEEADRDAG